MLAPFTAGALACAETMADGLASAGFCDGVGATAQARAAPPLLVHRRMLHAGCMLWPATAHEAMWSHRRFIVFESLRASTHASAAVLLEEVTPPAPRGARLAVSRWRKQA